MGGRYVESGDGYDWIEDPVTPAPAAIDYSDPNWMSNLPISLAAPTYGLPPGTVIESTPGDLHPIFTPESGYKEIAPSFFKDIPQTISKDSYNPAAYTYIAGGDETGSGAYSQTSPVMRDIGGNMQGAYDPDSGKLQNIYYKDQSKGGYWDTSGNFIPYQSSGGGFGDFLSGMFSGFKDLATSDMVKTLAPMVLTGGLGGAAGVGQMLGTNALVGGAALGAGTAALTGGDILKGAITGGIGGAGQGLAGDIGGALGAGKDMAPILGGAVLGGGTAALTGQNIGSGALLGGLTNAGGVKIGDTGINLGQIGTAAKVLDNIENGNLLAAVTGATNLAGAGNTQIGDTGLTVNDLAKDINLAKAVISGNPQLVSNALFSVANSAANSAVQADANASKAINPYFQTGAGTGEAPAEYAANDVGTQQLIDALTNAPAAAGPSVQVASSAPNAALTALQERIDADAGRAGGAGSGTYFDSLGRLHVVEPGEDLEAEQARAEAAIAADATPVVDVTAPYDSSAEPGFETWTPPEDFSTEQEPGFETWNPPVEVLPEEYIPEMVITAPRETEPIDYSTFDEDMLRQIQDLQPAEDLPVTSAPKIPVTSTPKPPATTPVKTTPAAQAKAQAEAQAKKDAAAAAAAAAASVQEYMPGIGDVAHIKSLESLFGPILGTLPAEQTNEKQDDSLSALEGMDQEYASGGHVDDFSVEALLHILRS